ncbi:hypothetical protein [Nocardioides nanhaiensis]|uniref:hypothetical protein n=1 Tax=Nocardioides nanhaiensis TaxID=1476871 RepID=UPI0031F0D241
MGGLLTWVAYRRWGLAAGLKGAGLSLLPLAAYLTDTLRMATRIGDAVVDWATALVFSPSVWAGVVVAGLGVVLFVIGRGMQARGRGTTPRPRAAAPAAAAPDQREPLPRGRGKAGRAEPAVGDDDLADIEALLKKRGIT